jgi:hypothetical protein
VLPALAGAGLGAAACVLSVATIGGTVFRPTPEGPLQFVFFRNLAAHVRSAATKPFLWVCPLLWSTNLFLMTATGAAVGYAAAALMGWFK